MPKMIGTINGYVKSPAKFGRKKFNFDGTTLGLVCAALESGAKIGDTVRADYGAGFKPYTLYSNPMDNRAGGVWLR